MKNYIERTATKKKKETRDIECAEKEQSVDIIYNAMWL